MATFSMLSPQGVRGADIKKYRPDLRQEEVVYPAVTVMMTGQKMRQESSKTFIEGCCVIPLLEGQRCSTSRR